MAFVQGIKAIKELREKAEKEKAARGDRDRPKTTFFKLDDGESRRVRFLQELDEESPNYNPDAGIGIIMIEHQGPGPEGWKRRAQCTLEEGQCYPCEQRAAGDYENWRKPKSVMYLNVLENPGTDDEKVSVLSQAVFGQGIIGTLIEYASDEEMGGSITDREWKITRNGEGTESKHTAVAYGTKEFDKPVTDYELFDLTQTVAKVPYERQEAFYTSNGKGKSNDEQGNKGGGKPKENDFLGW